MKCSNCQAMLNEGTTVCPYCGKEVENMESVLPTTPSTPVLPDDQDMVVEPLMKDEITQTSEIQSGSVETSLSSDLEDSTTEERINSEENSLNVDDVINETINDFSKEMGEVDTTIFEENSMNPDGTIGKVEEPVGEKITNVPVEKQKSKKGLLVLVLIILVLVGAGVGIYYFEFKTADKRMQVFVDKMFSFTNSYTNANLNSSSGKYNIDSSVEYNGQKFFVSLDGNYAYDISKKVVDFKVNLNKLNSGSDLIPSPLKLEAYVNNKKAYLLASNFYDKYISIDLEDDLFNKNTDDIDFRTFIAGIKRAASSSLKNANKTQSIEKIKIDDKEELTNVVSIKLTENNIKKMYTTFINNIINNEGFLKELSKVSEVSQDSLKNELTETIDNFKYNLDIADYFELYSDPIKSTFKGAKLYIKNNNDDIVLMLLPTEKGYKIVVKNNQKEIIDFKVSSSKSRTSETIDQTVKLDAIVNIDETNKFSLSLEVKDARDINTKIEPVNVKNSIDYRYIPEDDLNMIISKITSYGNVGSSLEELIDAFIPKEIPDQTIYENSLINNEEPVIN